MYHQIDNNLRYHFTGTAVPKDWNHSAICTGLFTHIIESCTYGVNSIKEVTVITKYREILRLTALGFSQRDICSSAGVSQKTVSKVQKRARELQLPWPLDESMTDIALSRKLFPHEAVRTERRMPDFEYVRKELQRNGVTKKLLWTEYLEECC